MPESRPLAAQEKNIPAAAVPVQPAAIKHTPEPEPKPSVTQEKIMPAASAPVQPVVAARKPAEQPPVVNHPASVKDELSSQDKEDAAFEMQLVIKQDEPPVAAHPKDDASTPEKPVQDEMPLDEMEEQKRRASERIQKLRNLSFNINGAESNTEFESVPAYIRRNLELYNTVSSAENFYSNYSVKSDSNNKSQISTINTFLDGKKPD